MHPTAHTLLTLCIIPPPHHHHLPLAGVRSFCIMNPPTTHTSHHNTTCLSGRGAQLLHPGLIDLVAALQVESVAGARAGGGRRLPLQLVPDGRHVRELAAKGDGVLVP